MEAKFSNQDATTVNTANMQIDALAALGNEMNQVRFAPQTEGVQSLEQVCSGESVTGTLYRYGLVPECSNRWTKGRMTALRSYRKISVVKPNPNGQDPWPNLSKTAKILGVASKTLWLASKAREFSAQHPLEDGP